MVIHGHQTNNRCDGGNFKLMTIINCDGFQIDTENLPSELTEEMVECMSASLPPEPPPPSAEQIEKERQEESELINAASDFLKSIGATDEIARHLAGVAEFQSGNNGNGNGNGNIAGARPEIKKIEHGDFDGMGEVTQERLAENGIVTVEQLAEHAPIDLDSLPIKGITLSKAEDWVRKAREMI